MKQGIRKRKHYRPRKEMEGNKYTRNYRAGA
jgi:hypothetical protein